MIVEMIEHEIKEASVEELHQAVQTSSINFVFLYAAFVQVGGERVIKVGKSCDVLARMKELKGRLICCWPETRLLDEREVHYRLRTFRFHHDSSRELYMDVTVVRERVLGWAKPWGKLAKVRKPRTQKPWRTSGGTTKRDWGSCLTCGKMFYQGKNHVNPNLYCSYDCTPAGCNRNGRRVGAQTEQRNKKDRDGLFAAYEGLAEKAASRVWGTWAEGLTDRGYTLDDLRQQAKFDLLGLVKSAKSVGGGFSTYVWKTLTGRLRNRFIAGGILRDLVRISQKELENLPDTSIRPPDETDYYVKGNPPIWLECGREGDGGVRLTPVPLEDFYRRMLVGDSFAQACRAVGWTKPEIEEALTRIWGTRRRSKGDGMKDSVSNEAQQAGTT